MKNPVIIGAPTAAHPVTVKRDGPTVGQRATYDELVDVLEEALEFITGQEDVVDGDYGVPEPNAAMQMCNRIREALGQRPGP